jgi:anti-sigma-K factor RskA
MSDPCNQHPQAAAYLLGALTPAEVEDYREHLQACTSCRQEIERLAPAANALPATAAPVPVPDALIGRVMAQVRAEAELLNAAGPQADHPPTRTPWLLRRLTVVGAAASIAVAVLALLLFTGSPSSSRVIQARLAANIPGHAQVRQNGSTAELVVTNIPQPPAGEVYEVWLAKPHGAPQPTDALFSVTANGNASVDVPGGISNMQTLMVTAEPAGGSQHPTSPPIITATL